jgi:hypothetical protein
MCFLNCPTYPTPDTALQQDLASEVIVGESYWMLGELGVQLCVTVGPDAPHHWPACRDCPPTPPPLCPLLIAFRSRRGLPSHGVFHNV